MVINMEKFMKYVSLCSDLGFDFNEHVDECKPGGGGIDEEKLVQMAKSMKESLTTDLNIGSLDCVRNFEPKSVLFLSDCDTLIGTINSELHSKGKEIELILY